MIRLILLASAVFLFFSCSNSQFEKELKKLKSENDSLKTELLKTRSSSAETEIKFVQLVKFKTALPDSEVVKTINERKVQFLEVRGLKQKYYMREKLTGEYSGIYLWESEQDFLNYRETELGKTIAKAYKVEGKPRVELFEMIFPLRK